MRSVRKTLFVAMVTVAGGCGGEAPAPIPPRIDMQPVSLSVEECQGASFVVRASGGPPLAFQWLESGHPIAGATAASLAFDRVGGADDGRRFSVVVSTPSGSTTSDEVTLTVTDAVGEAVLSSDAIFRLASDGTTLYWTDGLGVRASSVDCSGPIRTLYERQDFFENAIGLALAPPFVLWTDTASGTVRSIPTTGGPVAVLASGVSGLRELAAGSGRVFWPHFGGIQTVALEGGPVVQLASAGTNASGIALDDRAVYWTDVTARAIYRVPIVGGDVVALASEQEYPGAIVSDGKFVYWTTALDHDTTQPTGRVSKVSRDGGTPVVLASQPLVIYPIALGDASIYWTGRVWAGAPSGTGSVARLPLDGTSVPSVIASGLDLPSQVTVDSRYVYWSDARGIVRRRK